jgi:hypothetical protein
MTVCQMPWVEKWRGDIIAHRGSATTADLGMRSAKSLYNKPSLARCFMALAPLCDADIGTVQTILIIVEIPVRFYTRSLI